MTNQKITVCAMKFSAQSLEKLNYSKKEQLTEVAQNFFHLLTEFAKLKKTNDMNILILENNLQDLTSTNCGLFQLYFYKNLFDPEGKSKIINHENLNKTTIKTVFNEIFTTDVDENEHLIKKSIEEYDL